MSQADLARPARPAAPAGHDRLDTFAIVIMTALCAFWGLQQVIIKVTVLQGLPPAMAAGLRSLVSAACLLGWAAWRGGRPGVRLLFRRDASLGPGLAMSLIFSIEFLLLFFGLRYTTASRSVLFLYTSPFFVALGVHLFVPDERLRLRQVCGLLFAFGGVAVAVIDGLRAGSHLALLGDMMVSGTAILWGSLTVLAKASPALRSVPPMKVLFYQVAGSAPIMIGVAAALGEAPSLAQASVLAWELVVFQGMVVSFASYLIWYWLITRYPAGRLAAFTFLTPLFGIAAGGWLLSEPTSLALALALVLVAFGLHLVNGGRGQSPNSAAPVGSRSGVA